MQVRILNKNLFPPPSKHHKKHHLQERVLYYGIELSDNINAYRPLAAQVIEQRPIGFFKVIKYFKITFLETY